MTGERYSRPGFPMREFMPRGGAFATTALGSPQVHRMLCLGLCESSKGLLLTDARVWVRSTRYLFMTHNTRFWPTGVLTTWS